LIWSDTFSARLASWNLLRDQCANLAPESALQDINSWWFGAPWQPYYLHWDDRSSWPDPWQLLSDNVYCDVARGLGILYTITLLDRADLAPASLILTQDGDNLVQVSHKKYILNWQADSVVNTIQVTSIKQQFQQEQIQ
jgi:hypothetical protein